MQRGIVGQVSESAVAYDAETTRGGSGGPVLNARGELVAVTRAVIPEYGGSNLGVPVSGVLSLLSQAGVAAGNPARGIQRIGGDLED